MRHEWPGRAPPDGDRLWAYPPPIAADPILDAATALREAEDALLAANNELAQARGRLVAAAAASGWRAVWVDDSRVVVERGGETLEIAQLIARARAEQAAA